ncbi:MFS transporter [Streptomyces alboflavus]|uniref:MFS transporter n=1 Tax=Streptomyces alboflavus TaxID=67267 RepID=UPI0036945F24
MPALTPRARLLGPPEVPAAARPGRRSPAIATCAALLGFAVITIDVSAVNIALPAIRSSLHGGITGQQWVVDAYTLMFAALMLSAGAMADRSGARRAYAWGVGLFTVASLGCALAPDIGTLITARVLQGAAAAVVMPASLALIRQAHDDPKRRAHAVALWSVGGSLAMAVGPVLGGVLAEAADWRAVFLLNLPLGLLILALLLGVERSAKRPAPFDPAGQIAAVLVLAAVAYAMIEGGHAGWTSWPVAAALAVAVAAAVTFRAVEARHRSPMVPLDMLRQREVSVPLAVGFAISAGYYGTFFTLGLYYQQLRGMSGTQAGLMFVPIALVATIASLRTPRLVERFGRRRVIVQGQLVLAGSLLVLLGFGSGTPHWALLLLLLPFGIGTLTVPALTALLMDSVPSRRTGIASGLLNSLRQTGGALAVALFGSLVATQHDAYDLEGLRVSLLLAAALLCATAALSQRALPRS